MRLFPFSTLRLRLLSLVLLAVMPGFVLISYTAREDWRREKAGVHERALLLARLASSHQERMIENGFQFLSYLARCPETQKPQSHLCSKALGAFLEDNPHYANIGVADPEGNVLCSAFPLLRPVNIGFRPEFKQVTRTRKFTVGGYRFGVITKKPILPLYYPDFDPAGRVGRVIFATLDLGWLNKFAGEVDLPPDSTLTVIDQDGIVLIRHPDPDRWVGKSVAKNPFIGAIQSGRPEGLVESADLDGVPRLYAYTPFGASREARAYLAVGVSTTVAYGPISRIFKLTIILLGVVTLTALGLTWIWSSLLVLRPVNALAHSLERVSGGDLTSRLNPRSGPREIRGMAVSFNQMAEALEKHDAERVRAEEENERLLDQLRKRRGQLQSLNQRLVEAHESERRELARELHDAVGQALTVLALNLNKVKNQLPPQGFEEEEVRLGGALASVAEVVGKIRDVMADLRPPVLDDYGLTAALHWYAERFEAQTGIKVLFQGEEITPRLPLSSELALFRIAQEGLTNVVRHSGAKEALVSLVAKKKTIQLSITDEGAGFDASRRSPEGGPRGLGLVTMKERAEAIRAQLRVFSMPGRGTRVLVTVRR